MRFLNLIPILIFFSCAFPAMARACSVCFTATGQSLYAYYGVTIFLTLLPFLLGVGVFYAAKYFGKE